MRRGVDETVVLEIEDFVTASNHNGGNLTFGPDGLLYVTVGDGGGSPGRAQDDTNLLGKILRLDVSGKLPVSYSKPSELFYAKGLRNSFDMAWNPLNNVLYATENGPIGRDEINMIVEGGNYGWPDETGSSGLLRRNKHTEPLWDFGIRSVAPTGITFYPPRGTFSGEAFPPEYAGNLFIVDYNYGRVYRIRLSGEDLDTIRADDFEVWMDDFGDDVAFADITVGPNGMLYLAGFTKIIKIEYKTSVDGR